MAQSEVIIDKRPIALVLLGRTYQTILLVLIALGFYSFASISPWQNLSVEGYYAIGIFFVCLVLWVTQLLPLPVSGLFAIVSIPLLGIMPSAEAFSYFGNEAIFFILGAFIFSAALLKTGLSTRMAVLFLRKGSDSPKKLIWRILISCALLSCIMPEHAVAAFFLPIILEMTRALKYLPHGGSYGRTLFMAMAWGCIIGGIVTFLGGARAPLALGILQEIAHQQIGFLDWMKTTAPLAIVMIGVGYGLILKFFPIDVDNVNDISIALENRIKKIGLIMSLREKGVAFLLVLSVYCWIFHGHSLGLANISIAAVVLLFVFRLVTWEEIEENVHWGIILMYGGAICLGRALDSSGAIGWLADNLLTYPESLAGSLNAVFGWEIKASMVYFVALSFLALILSEVVSNAAVVALLLPVSIGIAQSYGMNAELMAYAVAIPAGLASLFPISTPPMALVFSSGYLEAKDILVPGLIMNFVGWFLFVVFALTFWPMMGMGF